MVTKTTTLSVISSSCDFPSGQWSLKRPQEAVDQDILLLLLVWVVIFTEAMAPYLRTRTGRHIQFSGSREGDILCSTDYGFRASLVQDRLAEADAVLWDALRRLGTLGLNYHTFI